MGSDESHFHVSFIVRDKVTKIYCEGQSHQPNALPLDQTGSLEKEARVLLYKQPKELNKWRVSRSGPELKRWAGKQKDLGLILLRLSSLFAHRIFQIAEKKERRVRGERGG